jgi:hypothetical protein
MYETYSAQVDYDANGNVTAVSAYNDTLNEYGLYEPFKVTFNRAMQEFYVLPQYASERY